MVERRSERNVVRPASWRRPEEIERLRAEDRRRMLENVAAFLFVAALTLSGFWLIDRLDAYSRNLTCLQSGQKSCRTIK